MENYISAETSQFIKHFDGQDAIDSFTRYQCDLIINGSIDPLQYIVRAKALTKALSNIESQIKDEILKEASKYGEKTFKAFNAEISIRDVGVSYDYKECGDIAWEKLDSEIRGLNERKKERESFLKTLKTSMTIVDPDTAEVSEIMPPIKKGSESVVISFK